MPTQFSVISDRKGLFDFLKLKRKDLYTSAMHNSGNLYEFRKTIPRYLIIIYILFTTGILVTGGFFYNTQKKRVLEERTDDLIAVNTLKSGQIQTWLKERKGDAIIIKDNIEFIRAADEFFKKGQYSGYGILKWLESIRGNFDYGNILLLDERLKVRLTLDESDTIPDEIIENEIQDLKKSREIIFTDFHRSAKYDRVHSDALIPLIYENRFIGVVILRIDPSIFLFPLVQSWPTSSRSSETLIIRQEDDRVRYINELRHLKNTPLSFWLPLTDTATLDVKAALGATGIVEGIDYLENPVLGYCNPIIGTNWILITKTDKNEIYEPIEQYRFLIIIIILSLILINSSIFVFWIWNQRVKAYRSQLKEREKLSASEKLYRNLFDNMLNGFAYCRMIFDLSGNPADFEYIVTNSSFAKLTGLVDVDGKRVSEVIPGILDSDQDLINNYGRIALGGSPEVFETYVEALSMWFSVSVYCPEKGFFVTIFDVITNRKLAEETLIKSEERFRSALENMLEGCQIISHNWKYLYLNRTADSHNRRPGSELIGNIYMEMWPGIEETDVFPVLKQCMEDRLSSRMETRFVFPDGTIGWFELSIQPVPEGIFILSIDITERKLAEIALKESEEKFRYLFNHSTLGLSMTRISGESNVNKAFSDLLGYSQEDLKHKKWQDITHPDDIDLTMSYINPILEGKTDHNKFIKRYLHSRGHTIWADVSVILRRDFNGNPLYFLTALSDITDRKNAEELLTIQKRIGDIFLTISNDEMYFEILSLILEKLGSPLGVFGYIDREGSLVVPSMISHIWERCKMTDKRVIFPKDSWGNTSWPRAIREKRVDFSNSASVLTPEGHVKLNRFISFPILFQGDVIGLFQAANKESDYNDEDIQFLERISNYLAPILNARLQSEWTRDEIVRLNNNLERRVEERTAQLEEANRELESFSYSVSHDLRAPLRSVSGFTKILLDEYGNKLDAEGQRLCSIITSSSVKMGELIDDLLNFSRIGRSTLTRSRVNMNELVASVYNDITDNPGKCRVKLKIEHLPEIIADAALMRIVWNNLLNNAIKYSSKKPEPVIIIDSERSDNMIIYTVKDNGAGFDMKYLDKLFGVFQRLHTEDEFEGNGVGLAIVHRIITRHSGKVWAESNPGEGAKFFISLPVN